MTAKNLRPSARALIAAAVFAAGLLYDFGLQALYRPEAGQGVYFHPWSSEVMMQTVPIEDLRSDPLRTLTYIHIQPPAFDILRAALVQLWPALEIHEALKRVDTSIYVIWAVLLGLMGSMVFVWLSAKWGTGIGISAAVLLYLHPATIYYATFLDSTFLSAFLFLWLCFLLWRLKNGAAVSPVLLAVSFLALFFTRSIFQWPSLLVLAASLAFMGLDRRQLLTFLLICGAVSGLYLLKQYRLFHTLSTSTFAGYSLANSIGVGWDAATYSAYLPDQQNLTATYGDLPDVLLRKTKLEGLRNFNNIAYVQLDGYLGQRYREKLLATPITELARSYLENAALYFQPSTEYRESNVIVEHLPWKNAYNAVFSAPVLPGLLILSLLIAGLDTQRNGSWRSSIGLALPAVYVFLASVLFDRGENMRFKFWLEPVMLIFIVAQLACGLQRASRLLRSHSGP